MDLDTARARLGKRDAKKATRSRRTLAWIATAIAALFAVAPAALAAAPVQGTPDPVAAGVPGNGRAWELVTPPEVIPGRIHAFPPLIAMTRSGDRLVYQASGSLPSTSFGGLFSTNLAERGSDGWVSTPFAVPDPEGLTPEGELFGEEGPAAFNPELTASLWTNRLPTPSKPVGLFASNPGGGYTLLATGVSFVGASEDLQQIVFETPEHLLPADAARTEGQSVYEIDGSTLSLVDVNDEGSLISHCGAGVPLEAANPISSEGQRIFFSARPECGPYGQVYLRAGGQTTEISASQCTLPDPECGPAADVTFLGATPSGSAAFLATAERLTSDDSNSEQDIYRYDTASGKLTLLSARPPTSTVSPSLNSIRASSDGSRVYFSAPGQLLPGQGAAGTPNLYLADAQGVHLIAPLAKQGGEEVFTVSEDGRYVVFPTPAPLVSKDTDESVDLYRHDTATGIFTLVSGGLEGRGNGAFDAKVVERTSPGDLGQRIFFTTAEQLLPQDRNEEEDVYEWTKTGLGLVSAGTPGFSAEYAGATPDGRTVFFITGATLLPRDRDGGELDVYAARIGGGFPEPAAATSCEGGACEATLSPPTAHRLLPTAVAKPRIGLAHIDAATRRRIVTSGSAMLLAEVPAGGRLSAQGRARIGSHELTAVVGSAKAKQAGPVRLRLRLTQVAQRELAQGRQLQVHLVLRQPAQGATLKTSFSLEGRR